MISAPLLFTIPLFMFTKQLHRAKKRAVERYHRRAIERAVAFEQKWLEPRLHGKHDAAAEAELTGLSNLNAVYDHIRRMRVVPFDARSFLELTMQTVRSLLPFALSRHSGTQPQDAGEPVQSAAALDSHGPL